MKPTPTTTPTFTLGQLLLAVFFLAYLLAFFPVVVMENSNGRFTRLDAVYLGLNADYGGLWGGALNYTGITIRLGMLAYLAAYGIVAAAIGFVILRWLRPQVASSRLEQWVFATALGLSVLSLITLICGLFGFLSPYLAIAIPVIAGIAFAFSRSKVAQSTDSDSTSRVGSWWLLFVPIGAMFLLHAMNPPRDFDVLEYHLQAPREFYENGRIGFLPHNIYANMPLGAEMHALAAMVATRQMYWGAMAGKVVFASYTLLTAAALVAFGKRYKLGQVGPLSAAIYLTVPWVALVSISGLIDGVVGCYTFLALYAAVLWDEEKNHPQLGWRRLVLCGLMAGSAVACKYPAVLFCCVPIAGWIAYRQCHCVTRYLPSTLTFVLATSITCGPWLVKNAMLTGNPVYPLLYNVFGGKTRDPVKDARWTAAHSPPNFAPSDLVDKVQRVLLRSEWLSPALVPLMVLAVWHVGRRRWEKQSPADKVGAACRVAPGMTFNGESFSTSGPARQAGPTDTPLWLIPAVAWLGIVFALWWLCTHRIDRFLVPALPVAALVGGMAWRYAPSKLDRGAVVALVALSAIYLGVIQQYGRVFGSSELCDDVTSHFQPAKGYGEPNLLLGDAAVFMRPPRVLYNTCWDDCVLETLIAGKSPEQARQAFLAAKVALIEVDWSELERYRSEGNYGYSPFPTPELFESLVSNKVLRQTECRCEHGNLPAGPWHFAVESKPISR